MRRYPASFAHGSFAFGAQLNSDGTPNEVNVHNAVTIDEREDAPGFRTLRDPYHLAQGSALGRAHKNVRVIRLRGRILVPDASQKGSLSDKERAMRAAFDPYLCYLDSPSTEGAYAFDFSEDTTDTATYPTGRIPQRYYVRPAAHPRIIERSEFGVRDYELVLEAADPRCFYQTEETKVLTPGAPTGDVVNRGTVPAPLKATILMAGAGSATFTIRRAGVDFILTLAGLVNLDSVVVLFETSAPYGLGRTVKLNGASAFPKKVSSAATWLDVPVGTTSFSILNTTNVTSATLAWHGAWA